jgi:uncharacterized coiled-coil protein SlyX
MSDPDAAAVEGSFGIGTSDLMAALEKALNTATEGEKDKIRRQLGITASEAPTAGNGQSPGTTAASETPPVRPVAVDNRFALYRVSPGTVLSIIATLIGAFIVYSLSGLSSNMEARFADQATRITGLENRITGLENKLENRINGLENKLENRINGLENKLENRISALDDKYDAKIDALIKTVTDMRVDIGKLQALMTGQLAPAGDTERPRTSDDSAGAGNPDGSAPPVAGPEQRP